PTYTLKVSPVDESARRIASSRRSSWRVVNGPSSTSRWPLRPGAVSPAVTCASCGVLVNLSLGGPLFVSLGPGQRRAGRGGQLASPGHFGHLLRRREEPHRRELERTPGTVALGAPRTTGVDRARDEQDDRRRGAGKDQRRLDDRQAQRPQRRRDYNSVFTLAVGHHAYVAGVDMSYRRGS